MFEEQAKQELFETVKAFHACKQEDGQLVSSYLLKMKTYLDTSERLVHAMPNELGAETPVVLAIREGRIQKEKKKSQGSKGKDKGKIKLAYAPTPKIPPPPKRYNSTKDSVCHHCKEVCDTGCGTHICNSTHGLKRRMKLKHGALKLYVGNGMRAAVEAIGSFDLILPNGLVIVLENCHYHCRLGHINKKHIEKLRRDRILQPTDDESFEICKSCISGKIARKLFPHQVERAKELLELIHTDVYGLFRTVSREGASYFITFTVENKLGKKIKAIRSDRGGEYLSREFIDHMKSCGIVSQLTPPYTPQHNGVWDCEALVKRDTLDKLKPRTIKCIFVGYPKETIGYYFYNPHENKMFVSRYVEFFEDNFKLQEASRSHRLLKASEGGLELIQEDDTQPSINTSEQQHEVESNEVEPHTVEVPICRSKRTSQAPIDMSLVDLPLNGRTVGSKWLFKKKTDMDGNMDVKTAFLNGHLNNNVYMVQLEEFVDPNHPSKLCKLQCSIYELKQAFRSWNKRFDEEKRMQRVPYASAIGSIMYAVIYSRLDVAFAQNLRSQFQQNPESEYIAAAEASMEVVWMRKFLDGLRDVMPSNKRPMEMLCNNASAIAITKDPEIIKGAMHYQRKYAFAKKIIK
uniref:Retrotransposon protein, putative, Ty1-copia subclass n=1 Tax=Tanacetum cinerariifolium TaxID=118510 RepID=A0A699HR88_TANCI|nr:hypothetical protein [Tanacetum cinerariifolium]